MCEGKQNGNHRTAPPSASEEELLSLVNSLITPPVPAPSELKEDDEVPAAPGPEIPESSGDEAFKRLRQLILGHEIADLEDLRRRFADPRNRAASISQVITEAVLLRNKKDKGLESALKPTVEHIFRDSVRQNPAELADSLFPVIGPAIRRSIAESIKAMFQDFSRTLEMSFSFKGLKWRLEALRTGRSFSEVVLLNTLEYQVEQLFLVKSDSGELLDHLVAEGALAHDGEQVAAMFTAVQQFVNDSFARGGLNTLKFGDVELVVVHSTLAYIVCVVRGQVPSNLRLELEEALEMVLLEYSAEIENFSGDSSVFIPSRRYVTSLITAKYKNARQVTFWARVLPYVLTAALLGGAVFFLYQDYAMERLGRRVYTETAGPGRLPLRVEPHLFKNWKLSYLVDDLADGPQKSLEALGLDVKRLDIVCLPYISQDAAIVEKRALRVLGDTSKSLSFTFNDEENIINLTGAASLTWLIAAYERLSFVPGIEAVTAGSVSDPVEKVTLSIDKNGAIRFEGESSGAWIALIKEKTLAAGFTAADFSRLRDPEAEILAARRAEAEAELNFLLNRVNSTVVLFPLNSDTPAPEDLPKLRAAVDDLAALEKLAADLKMSVSLSIYGHADASGSERRNYELSQERTKTLAAMLYAKGSRIPITNYGMGADFAAAGGEAQASRKIELRVTVNPLAVIEK